MLRFCRISRLQGQAGVLHALVRSTRCEVVGLDLACSQGQGEASGNWTAPFSLVEVGSPFSPSFYSSRHLVSQSRPMVRGQRNLESQLITAENQNSVWSLLLNSQDQVTPFLCFTAVKRVSKLINYGTPMADKFLQRQGFELLQETVERDLDECDAKLFASILNFSQRIASKHKEPLSPTLASLLTTNFMENIHRADPFSLGIFVASLTHHAHYKGGVTSTNTSTSTTDLDSTNASTSLFHLDEGSWHKVMDRVLALEKDWSVRTSVPILHSLDILETSGREIQPEVWQVLFEPFSRTDLGKALTKDQMKPMRFNVVVDRMIQEGSTKTLHNLFSQILEKSRYDVIFNHRWRHVVENMPENFGENIDREMVDGDLLSFLGRKKSNDLSEITHSIWSISKLGLPVSEEPLSRLVSLAVDNLEEIGLARQILILRSLTQNKNRYDKSHYHVILSFIASHVNEFSSVELCDVLRSVGRNSFHSESESVWRIIYTLLNRPARPIRKHRFKYANIIYGMGGIGKHDSHPLDILKICDLSLREVNNFQANELKLSLDGLANITSNHQIHEDYSQTHEELYQKIMVAIHQRLEKWKLNSHQCAYLLGSIARSDTIHAPRFGLVETTVQGLVEQFVGRRLIDPKDIVKAIKAIAEIDAVISDEMMKRLLHKVVEVKLSQEDLGRVLKSLSDISHWFEVDNDLLEIFNDL